MDRTEQAVTFKTSSPQPGRFISSFACRSLPLSFFTSFSIILSCLLLFTSLSLLLYLVSRRLFCELFASTPTVSRLELLGFWARLFRSLGQTSLLIFSHPDLCPHTIRQYLFCCSQSPTCFTEHFGGQPKALAGARPETVLPSHSTPVSSLDASGGSHKTCFDV